MLKNRNYSQAFRIGDRVEISGQGGWDDELNFPESLDDEIVQAFDNVERTLATAGAGWRDRAERDPGSRGAATEVRTQSSVLFMVQF